MGRSSWEADRPGPPIYTAPGVELTLGLTGGLGVPLYTKIAFVGVTARGGLGGARLLVALC